MSLLQKAAGPAWIAVVLVVFGLTTISFGLQPQGPVPWDGNWLHFRYLMYDTALGYGLTTLLVFLGAGWALIFGSSK